MAPIDTIGYNPDEERAREIDAELARVFGHIEPAAFVELPAIDPDVFGTAAQSVEQAVDVLKQFLATPYITDIFGTDHTRRREWRRSFLAKYGEQGRLAMKPYMENKFRANILSRPGLFIENAEMALERTGEVGLVLAGRMEEAWDTRDVLEILDAYPRMDEDQRRVIIKNIENRAVHVLRILAEASEQRRAIA